MHHADRIVERVVVDDQPRMPGALEGAHQLAERDVLLHGDDVGARYHHVADPRFVEPQDIFQHPAFFRREAGFAGRHGVEHILQVGADRARLPAKQHAQHAREEAFAVAVRLHDGHRQMAWLEGTGGTWRVAVRHRGQALPGSCAR